MYNMLHSSHFCMAINLDVYYQNQPIHSILGIVSVTSPVLFCSPLHGKAENRRSGLECRPVPHEQHRTRATPKTSYELANAFGQHVRLSADFEKREREASYSCSIANVHEDQGAVKCKFSSLAPWLSLLLRGN